MIGMNISFLAARAHINRLCLAARVPLIDGGSAGYRGQVILISSAFL